MSPAGESSSSELSESDSDSSPNSDELLEQEDRCTHSGTCS